MVVVVSFVLSFAWTSAITAIAEAAIALEFADGKERAVELVRTDRRGRYQAAIDPRWSSVQAFFAGNGTLRSAQSERVPLRRRSVKRRPDEASA